MRRCGLIRIQKSHRFTELTMPIYQTIGLSAVRALRSLRKRVHSHCARLESNCMRTNIQNSSSSSSNSPSRAKAGMQLGDLFLWPLFYPGRQIYAINYKDRNRNKLSPKPIRPVYADGIVWRMRKATTETELYMQNCMCNCVVWLCPVEMLQQSFTVNCPSQSVSIYFSFFFLLVASSDFIGRHKSRQFFFSLCFYIGQSQIYVLIMFNECTTQTHYELRQHIGGCKTNRTDLKNGSTSVCRHTHSSLSLKSEGKGVWERQFQFAVHDETNACQLRDNETGWPKNYYYGTTSVGGVLLLNAETIETEIKFRKREIERERERWWVLSTNRVREN